MEIALMRGHLFGALVTIALTVVACGDGGDGHVGGDGGPSSPTDPFGLAATLSPCGNNTAVFTALPVAQSDVGGWVPLGAMNPSGHTFPTDHQYIYLKTFGSTTQTPVPLYAPGNITVVGARSTTYAGTGGFVDYSILFSSCRETFAEFGHVRSIAPSLLARLPAFDQGCNTYSPAPGSSVTACWTKGVEVSVAAGETIGTTAGLDLWLFDTRITPITYANPARWGGASAGIDHFHVVPFSDYFAEPMRSTVQSMLGSYDGRMKRTIPPLGGTIGTDVPGTAQGTWFFGTAPTYPESPHLAISPNHVDPRRIEISMGTSGGSYTSGLRAMMPSEIGPFNRHPAQITPGSTVHCWDLINAGDFGAGYGVVLLQLTDATTLRIEGRLGSSATCANQQPSALTAAAVTFRR